MNIRYDPEADAMYIKLGQGKVHKTKEVDDNTLLDYDEKGNIIGIEILFVKERMPTVLEDVKIENIPA